MRPQLLPWRRSLKNLAGGARIFEKWLFVAASKVLFSDKPAELILIREASLFEMRIGALIERTRALVQEWGLSTYILMVDAAGAKTLIYDRTRVNRVLKQVQNMPFYISLGYPQKASAEEFFGEVKKRWELSGEMPHEIAVTLGYPVKDVVGFLNLVPLKYRGTYGWKVYGDLEPSLSLKAKYDRAKQAAFDFLQEKPEDLFKVPH